ncbi:MAG TPA: hypothetical protein VF212_11890 [Longimicrobiales bacterium]
MDIDALDPSSAPAPPAIARTADGPTGDAGAAAASGHATPLAPAWPPPMLEPLLGAAWRAAAEAMVARALLALDAGRVADAETTLREVVSVGVLLADASPFIIDALAGAGVAGLGLTTLRALYAATGRPAEAERIASLSDAVQRAASVAGGGVRAAFAGAGGRAGAAPGAVALDEDAPRALRWAMASAHVGITECGSLRHRLFGESQAYRAWKEKARATLVRSPGEAGLFEVMVETPVRFGRRRDGAGGIAALLARLLPGGPRCSGVWAAM